MLKHAFERLGCMRVEFKTDSRNERSRAALAALPAQFEGIFRRHMIIEDIGVRDSAYYSITDEEWPEPPARRHGLIFDAYDQLAVGSGFVLVNDHDPKPLYYQTPSQGRDRPDPRG